MVEILISLQIFSWKFVGNLPYSNTLSFSCNTEVFPSLLQI